METALKDGKEIGSANYIKSPRDSVDQTGIVWAAPRHSVNGTSAWNIATIWVNKVDGCELKWGSFFYCRKHNK